MFCCLEAAYSSHCVLSLGWLKGLVHNQLIYWRPGYRELCYLFFKPRRSTVLWTLIAAPLRVSRWRQFFSTVQLHVKIKKTITDVPARTQFWRFLSNPPRSSFKKLILSTPSLRQGLHAISLAKSVPDALKPQECKRSCLCEPPPVPYVPENDEVQ